MREHRNVVLPDLGLQLRLGTIEPRVRPVRLGGGSFNDVVTPSAHVLTSESYRQPSAPIVPYTSRIWLRVLNTYLYQGL
jgi:hypothetical protein